MLFGPERTGLSNDDLIFADAVLSVPVNPDFFSLNLAQAVLLVGYEWFQAGGPAPPRQASAAGRAARPRASSISCSSTWWPSSTRRGSFAPPIGA